MHKKGVFEVIYRLMMLMALLFVSSGLCAAEKYQKIREIKGWHIIHNTVDERCFAYGEYGSGTEVYIGLQGPSGDWFITVKNKNWTSIKEGENYAVKFIFNNRRVWDSNSIGTDSGFRVVGLQSRFVRDFAGSRTLELRYQGNRVDKLNLRGTRRAANAVSDCYRNRIRKPDPFKTDDPFKAKPKDPFQKTAPAQPQDPFGKTDQPLEKPTLTSNDAPPSDWQYTDRRSGGLGKCYASNGNFHMGYQYDGNPFLHIGWDSADLDKRLTELSTGGSGIVAHFYVDARPYTDVPASAAQGGAGLHFSGDTAIDRIFTALASGQKVAYRVPDLDLRESFSLAAMGESWNKLDACKQAMK